MRRRLACAARASRRRSGVRGIAGEAGRAATLDARLGVIGCVRRQDGVVGQTGGVWIRPGAGG